MAWADSVCELIHTLKSRAFDRLRDLQREAPTGGIELFEAWRAVAAIVPVEAATNYFQAAEQFLSGDAGRPIADLIAALAQNVYAALDRGENDPTDPLVREKDFPQVFRIQAGPFHDQMAGFLNPPLVYGSPSCPAVPAGSPLRTIEPFTFSNGQPGLVLGPKLAPTALQWRRLSKIAERTAWAVAQGKREEEDRRRAAEMEREQARRALVHAERELAALRERAGLTPAN